MEPTASTPPICPAPHRGPYDALLFDLDGTLWDACDTIAMAANEGLTSAGVTLRMDRELVAAQMGLTFDEIWPVLLPGVPEDEWRRIGAAVDSRELPFLRRHGAPLYPGVAEGIARLAARFPLALVSNCQAGYIECFLEHSGLAPHFVDFECHGRTGLPKSQNISALAARHGWNRLLYLGDTEKDGRAARKAGADFAFAAWGFGQLHAAAGSGRATARGPAPIQGVGSRSFGCFSDFVAWTLGLP